MCVFLWKQRVHSQQRRGERGEEERRINDRSDSATTGKCEHQCDLFRWSEIKVDLLTIAGGRWNSDGQWRRTEETKEREREREREETRGEKDARDDATAQTIGLM